MAGELAGFVADDFRMNIRNTMIMGLPVAIDERPTFYFPPSMITYPAGTRLDSEGRPIDPRVKAVPIAPDPVQVPCAVEFTPDTTNDTTTAGPFWTGRAVLTVLDIDYALIEAAIEVDLAKRRYLIQELTEVGLGTVTVYQLYCWRKGVESP